MPGTWLEVHAFMGWMSNACEIPSGLTEESGKKMSLGTAKPGAPVPHLFFHVLASFLFTGVKHPD